MKPKKVWANAINALSQSNNIFLYVEAPFEINTCIEKIKGSIFDARNTAIKNGKNFIAPDKNGLVLIFTKEKLYSLTWKDIL